MLNAPREGKRRGEERGKKNIKRKDKKKIYNQNSDFTFRVIFEKKKIKHYRTKMMRKSR